MKKASELFDVSVTHVVFVEDHTETLRGKYLFRKKGDVVEIETITSNGRIYLKGSLPWQKVPRSKIRIATPEEIKPLHPTTKQSGNNKNINQ
jgi:hypothetical protein